MIKLKIILAAFGILCLSGAVYGLATERIGPDSANSYPTRSEADWPKGIVEPLKLPSRVYSIWVNGGESFYFKADPNEINEIISLFSKARMRDHEVLIESGKKQIKSFRGDSFEYNVSLEIIAGIALSFRNDSNDPNTFEPKLHIYYVDDSSALNQLILPDNLIVHCSIEDCNIESKAVKPSRKRWFGKVYFDNSKPAADFEHTVLTTVTLWHSDSNEGMYIDRVDGKGFFSIALSQTEFDELKIGTSWLTLSVGNFRTEPLKEDVKFPIEQLSGEKLLAVPFIIPYPKLYYGRILFDDGSPPVFEPKLWSHAQIRVNFLYAGWTKLDSKGYFEVFLTPEQFDKLRKDEVRENIFFQSSLNGGSLKAISSFPANLLSEEKIKAGVVKIPIPRPDNNN